MEIKNIILGLFVICLLTVLVSAETYETNYGFYGKISNNGSLIQTTDQINDYSALGFVCANDDCSVINGTLWNGEVQSSGNDNQLVLTYPTYLIQKGYGVFFYKEGYFPFEAKIDYYGTQSVSANNYFTRKEYCEVPLNHLIISHNGNNITVNVTLDAGVTSPVVMAGPLNYVPDSIKHLYAIDSKVDFRFIGPNTVNITKNVNLPASESREVFASVDNLAAGEYRIEVESNTVDIKCINSVPNLLNSNLYIEGNRTNETLPLIGILSPQAKIYTNSSILINLRAINASSVWFNYNGTNISYSSPVYIDLKDGVYTLTAYAKNDLTTAFTSVIFGVNTTLPPNNTDFTPPSSISNLHLFDSTKNSLSWDWSNPLDSDFSQAIVYINGNNLINTSSNSYSASGLNSDTEYTITINTKDKNGNVNSTNVSLTSKTLKDTSNNQHNGNEDDDSSRKSIIYINDSSEGINPVVVHHYQDNSVSYSERDVKTKEKDYSSLVLLLFILTLLLIIIIIALLIIKRVRYI